MAKAKKQLPVFTVTQLNSLIGAALENALPGRFVLRGEITNWKRHSSGHCYFSLKDNEGGQIPCVMWGSKHRSVKFDCEKRAGGAGDGGMWMFMCRAASTSSMRKSWRPRASAICSWRLSRCASGWRPRACLRRRTKSRCRGMR